MSLHQDRFFVLGRCSSPRYLQGMLPDICASPHAGRNPSQDAIIVSAGRDYMERCIYCFGVQTYIYIFIWDFYLWYTNSPAYFHSRRGPSCCREACPCSMQSSLRGSPTAMTSLDVSMDQLPTRMSNILSKQENTTGKIHTATQAATTRGTQ